MRRGRAGHDHRPGRRDLVADLRPLLRVDLPQSVDRNTTSFTLTAADHTALFNGNPVTLTNSSGEKATVLC